MSERREISVSVFDQEEYDGEWPPKHGGDFIEFFKEKFAKVPGEFVDSIRVEIDSCGGYEGDHYGHISIEYTRPETDEEYSARQKQESAQEAYEIQRAYQDYLRLKAAFEPKPK